MTVDKRVNTLDGLEVDMNREFDLCHSTMLTLLQQKGVIDVTTGKPLQTATNWKQQIKQGMAMLKKRSNINCS